MARRVVTDTLLEHLQKRLDTELPGWGKGEVERSGIYNLDVKMKRERHPENIMLDLEEIIDRIMDEEGFN